jgi:hypothetical protein
MSGEESSVTILSSGHVINLTDYYHLYGNLQLHGKMGSILVFQKIAIESGN